MRRAAVDGPEETRKGFRDLEPFCGDEMNEARTYSFIEDDLVRIEGRRWNFLEGCFRGLRGWGLDVDGFEAMLVMCDVDG